MKEYIDRAAAMESILGLTIADPAVAQYADTVYYNLQRLPAADVVEVRHGRWIFKEYDEMPWCTQAICSECGAVVENNSSLTTESGEKYFLKDNQYCRKCGALMDKEDEDEVS